jgi:predicted aspartyl protease
MAYLLSVALAQGDAAPATDGSVPFMAVRGKLIVPVSAAGHGPYAFLLDSGINRPLLDLRTASELGSAATEAQTLQLASLEVGSLKVPQAVADVADLSALEKVLGTGVAGLLPVHWGDVGLAIDFGRGRMAYGMPGERRYSRYTTLQAEKDGLRVSVAVNGGRHYPARVDLSRADTFSVPKPLAEKLGLLNKALPRVEFDDESDERLQVRAESLELGDAELKNAVCSVRESGDEAVIGTGFLKHFNVFFDFANGKLWLSPLNPTTAEDEPVVAYGVVPGRIEEGYWTLRVAINSPAFRAGIKAGDRLKAIDDDDMQSKTYDEVSKRLAATPGRSAKLTILRGEETKDFKVQPEPLFTKP